MTIKELIYKVKVKLQELTPYGSGLAALDASTDITTPLTDGLVVLEPERYDKPVEIYIKECISESYDELVELAPSNLLPSKSINTIEVKPIKNNNGTGYINLPKDFHTLKLYKMKGWERPVTSTITNDNPAYIEQYNDYLRGGISKPVCAIINTDKGKVLEYYSLPKYFSVHEIEFGYYIPQLNIDLEDNSKLADLDERLISILIYLIVSRVQLIYEQIELSKTTRAKALEELDVIIAKNK